ncbi:hypothetical protein SF83666_c14990 [Sinorhizobium fredii CCBAU 83666]|nr:hypothetical protein SF83666_c14990 [Sinorhizobium fredii CCBAU 83666]
MDLDEPAFCLGSYRLGYKSANLDGLHIAQVATDLSAIELGLKLDILIRSDHLSLIA